MRWGVSFAAAIFLVTASQLSIAQIAVDMNQITCGRWLGYSPEERDFVRFWMSGYYDAAANSSATMVRVPAFIGAPAASGSTSAAWPPGTGTLYESTPWRPSGRSARS